MMPTRFAAIERRVSAAIDSLHGERTLITPRSKGEFVRGATDPDRLTREVLGIIDFNPVSVRARDKGEYDGFRPELDGDKIHVSYTADSLGVPPKDGDTITALDRPGQPKFQVSLVQSDGLGRVVCVCVPS